MTDLHELPRLRYVHCTGRLINVDLIKKEFCLLLFQGICGRTVLWVGAKNKFSQVKKPDSKV
jgi:hypothetical protein